MLTATPPPPIREPEEEATPVPTHRRIHAGTSTSPTTRTAVVFLSSAERTNPDQRPNRTNRRPPHSNAVGTPLGRYKKLLEDAIGSRWYYYMEAKIDLISIGTAHVEPWIRDGSVRNLRMTSNTANEASASICCARFRRRKFPPFRRTCSPLFPKAALQWKFPSRFSPTDDRYSSLLNAANPLQSIVSFLAKGRPLHVAVAHLLDCCGDTIILRSIALRERNVLPLVIESEIERLVARWKSRAACRASCGKTTPRSPASRGLRCNICAGRARKISKRSRPAPATKWSSWNAA